MAIVSDRKMIYERKIAELQTQLTEVSGSKRRPFSPGTALHAPKMPPPARPLLCTFCLASFAREDHHDRQFDPEMSRAALLFPRPLANQPRHI